MICVLSYGINAVGSGHIIGDICTLEFVFSSYRLQRPDRPLFSRGTVVCGALATVLLG